MAGTIEKFNEQVGRIEELIAAVKAMGFGEGDVTFEGETKASLQKRFQEILDASEFDFEAAAELLADMSDLRDESASSVVLANSARDAALLSRGLWQTTAQGIGQGVAGTASLVAGSGGTNGTFALAFSGGTQVIAPKGYFVVAGGVVTQVVITYAGHYSAGTPTLSFAASAGLTGASATTVMGANTQVGEYFSVPVSGSNDSLILYRVDAGPVATEVARYPASSALDFVLDIAAPGYQWSVIDEDGFAAIGVKDDGTFVTEEIETSALVSETYNGNGTINDGDHVYQWSIIDDDGQVAIGVRDDGTFEASSIETNELTVELINGVRASEYFGDLSAGGFTTEIVHIPTYGQSLSFGSTSSPVITTTQIYDSLMFNGGIFQPASRTSFVPLIESGEETPSGGVSDGIKELIFEEEGLTFNDQSYQLLFSADGQGGTTIATLSDPAGAPYLRLKASMQAGSDIAESANQTFSVPAFTWTQGEQDYVSSTTADLYSRLMEALRVQIQTDAQAITGRDDVVKMISYQVASHKVSSVVIPRIALGQLLASKEYDNIYLATPTYHLDYTDTLHLTAASSKKLGFHYAVAYKRAVIDGLNWKPLMPISKTVQRNLALVKFNVPSGRLVLDTTLVTMNTNYGFNLFDDGGDEVTITAVEVIGPETVKIVSPVDIVAGFKLQYAFYGSGTTGRVNGPRGNLRDTQGDTIIFDPSGLNYAAHNWCLMFEEKF